MMISPSLRMALHLNTGFALFLLPNQRFSSNGSLKYREIWKHSMSLRAKPAINDGVLRINGKEALKGVPENIVITPSTSASAFLGAVSLERSCRHIFKLGVLEIGPPVGVGDINLLGVYNPTDNPVEARFKIWWMIPRMGNSGSDVPVETQMLLLEAKAESVIDKESHEVSDDTSFYILFLPVLDGEFRSSLQGNSENELEFCMESGDPAVAASQFLEAVFVNYGDNPFNLLEESMKILEKHKGNFSHRSSKKMPEMLDWFGWCTWDAFYTEVNPQGIENGLKSLSEGGTPARFLIIDDGWQDTVNEFVKEGEPSVEGSQFGARLVSIKENKKFRRTADTDPRGTTYGLNDFVSTIKRTFGLKYVYVWHALMGYWGGVDPNAPGTKKYNSKLLYPVQSPGNLANIRDIAMDSLEKYGVGTIDPAKAYEFYDDLHSYLVSQNVDGVKVDVQSVMETLGTGFGGRVLLTRLFQQALEKSVARNFQDNSIICCMAHNTDSVYSLKASAITRASDDYMPRNQTTQTLHVATVAFNSLFFGEIVIPDWDMFYSRHYAAEFHAVARAVGGCGVYVSDKPGQHDFTILKRLVLPDGSVLRANYPGRPTRDCLFNDPVMDGKSLLKVWNLNNFSGVLGIFNCQGAGTWPFLDTSQSYTSSEQSYLTGHVSPIDIEFLDEVTGENCTSDCAVFCFKTGSLHHLAKKGSVDVSLKILECDIFTISPVRAYDKKVQFAPIGLIEMYNSGGAVEAVDFVSDHSRCRLDIKGRGSGQFGAYSSIKPKLCTVNSQEVEFEFNGKDKFLKLVIPPKNSSWVISIHFEA